MNITGMDAESFQERVLNEVIQSLGVVNLYVGHRLLLFHAMHALQSNNTPVTAKSLADTANIVERYALEWLRCVALHGYVSSDENGETFFLPEGHAKALMDNMEGTYTSAFLCWIPAIANKSVLDRLFQAFRGEAHGVPYELYGEDCLEAIGAGNRPMFVGEMEDWFAKVPHLNEKLTGGSAKVAEFGCGCGYAAMEFGKKFPKSTLAAIDADKASTEKAKANLQSIGVENVTVHHIDVSLPLVEQGFEANSFDCVCLYECLHDMSNPVGALEQAKTLLKPDGVVIIADEGVEDKFSDMLPTEKDGSVGNFSANAKNFVGRMNMSFSPLHCLPACMTEEDSAAIGTAIRPSQVVEIATKAGFSQTERFHNNGFWHFYCIRA